MKKLTLLSVHLYFGLMWITDLSIGLSYWALSIGLAISLHRRHSRLAYRFIFLFAAFIVLCGSGHLIDAWYGFERRCVASSLLKGVWNSATAFASLLTALLVLPKIHLYLSAAQRPFDVLEMEERLRMAEEKIAVQEAKETKEVKEVREAKEADIEHTNAIIDPPPNRH